MSEADSDIGHGWPQAHVDLAAQCWREGLSASQIAARLKVSRSAVCGFAHRNRDLMPPRGMGRVATRSPATGVASKAANVPAVRAAFGAGKASRRPEREAPRERAALPASIFDGQKQGARADLSRFQLPDRAPVAFSALERGQCRFPLAAFDAASGPDMPCCGAAVHSGAWCRDHMGVVYTRGT